MKLKKKAILYLEGMLNKEERDKFITDIKKKPDIHDFIKEYRWLESRLKEYTEQKNKPKGNKKKEVDLDDLVQSDIDKYLKFYQPENPGREKDFLNKLNQSRLNREKKPGRSYGLILNIAATVALIALLIAGLIHVNKNNRNNEFNSNLFADYFTPWEDGNIKEYKSSFVTIDKNSLNLTEEGKNISKYHLNTILRSNRMSNEDLLMISVLLIQENEESIAESYLLDIIEKSQDQLAISARYYLSLLYIKHGAIDKSIQNLEILCNENNSYTSLSCKLLGTLDKKNLD
ncbi:MAG: hypothetical protein ACP5E3_04440 [Bacteroidales bacterium]